MKRWWVIVLIIVAQATYANSIFIPMDESQRDHLKAYGLAFHTLSIGQPVDWLLNYRGGSFLIPFNNNVLTECKVRGISYELISSAKANGILTEIARPDVNMNVVRLETAPRVAVYSRGMNS